MKRVVCLRPPIRLLAAVLCASVLLMPVWAQAQSASPSQTNPPPAADPPPAEPRFFERVTVSATLSPATVKDTPGTVAVITDEAIRRGLMENAADLIRFEPGVYVESNLTRLGLNGFNIRGIGGNRVLTQVDGVETTEQFDFGPFNVHQISLDLDTLKSAEIVRSAGSSMYGSDALGGVVSFFTKDPTDYLGLRRFHIGAKTLYDGRARDRSGNVVVAGGSRRVQASVFASYVEGNEPRNQGSVSSQTASRTALNPQQRRGVSGLAKLTFPIADGNVLRGAVEVSDNQVATLAYSLRSAAVTDTDSDDLMARTRVSVDQSVANGLGGWSWSLFAQSSDTNQVVDELRAAAGPTPMLNRRATLDYTQDSYGGTVQGRRVLAPASRPLLLTFGGGHKHHTFDMLRDRLDTHAVTGAVIPVTNLILPTKYFPTSSVGETGAYLQGEMRIGRLTLLPGLRFDRFTLDADADDRVFIASLSPAAADFADQALSSRIGAAWRASDIVTVHAQYAGGFRAPPYSAVNSGFTNLLGGYTSVPNTGLRAETSDNVELGVRAAAGRVAAGATVFSNRYQDFIQQVLRGTNPETRLLEYQYQNVSRVHIGGVELQGEARLTSELRVRAAYALIRGNDVSTDVDVPLSTIAPDQATFGLQYGNSGNRWGADLTTRVATSQSASRVPTGQYVPAGYAVVDLAGWLSLTKSVTVRAAALNLTDARYFEWANVRGRSAADPVIDRYTSPGASGMVSLSYGW